MPVEDKPVHPHGQRGDGHRNSCHNRQTYKKFLEVQNGWYPDGRRKMKVIPFIMSPDCRYDQRANDPLCEGCNVVSDVAYLERMGLK